ncbi:MAG: MFS transporter [Stackebrandtia sp.]
MDTARPTRAGWRQWSGLALLSLPTMLLGLDVTALYLVVPDIAADLRPSATQTLWIMDAYGFLIAGFLITMGTLGDRVGRRRLLMIGTVGFGAASVLAAFAPSAGLLIAARALLGVAGATLMPSTLSLISNMFADARQRALAIGLWATMFAAGMAAGPVIGGVLVAGFWWGAVFLIAVPVAAGVLVLAPVLLPEYRAGGADRLDPLSVGLSLAALLPAFYALKHATADGLTVEVSAAALIAAAATIGFVRRQNRLRTPLLDLRLFGDRTFRTALAVLLVGLIGFGGVMYLVTQYLQLVDELSPTTAGLWMGPPAAAMLLGAVGAPLLARRVSPGIIMAATLSLSLLGYLLLGLAGTDSRLSVIGGFAFVYLALGVIAALGTDIVVSAAPPQKSGSAASLSETVQELGIAAGVAVLGSLTTARYRGGVDSVPVDGGTTAAAYGDSLSGAAAVADRLPEGALEHAKLVFTHGLNVSAAVAGLATAAAAAACFLALRRLPPLGAADSSAGGG